MSSLRTELDARGVLHLTLARPEKGNALDTALLAQLDDAVAAAWRDTQVRLLLLRGEGRHFCSGADTSAPLHALQARPVRLPDLCHALHEFEKPVVAMVQGACIGAGVALIACCDRVVADPGAFFSLPEVRLGFAPGPLMPFFLQAVPARWLRPHLLSGARFDAAEAHRIGLVHELLPGAADAPLPALDNWLRGAPSAQAAVKSTLRELQGQDVNRERTEVLQQRVDQARASTEAAEGLAALIAKRNPSWYR